MRKSNLLNKICAAALVFGVFVSAAPTAAARVYARDGIGGFDGAGISAGELPGRTTLDYQEYIFVTGEPVLLKGTLILTKSESAELTTATHSYRLNNTARQIQLTRDERFETVNSPKDGGQTVTETTLVGVPSEKIVTPDETYTLRGMEFTRSSLTDAQPGVNYYSGNAWFRKQYEVGGGDVTTASGNLLTVESTSGFYGFDQAWGNADVEETELYIDYTQAAAAAGGEEGAGNPGAGGAAPGAGGGAAGGDGEAAGTERDLWSGTVNVRRSQSTVTELRYVENAPTAISFRGGFLETRRNENVLEYTARLPEFSAAGIATDRLKSYRDSAQISTFPSTKRLVSPNLRQLSGHWAEEAVSKLFGLEVLTQRPSEFTPDQYITRAEFTAALVAAVPAVPADPFITRRGNTSAQRSSRNEEPVPSYTDVPADHLYFAQIEEALTRGLMGPADQNAFNPNDQMSVADAAVAFIRALGLESVATAHGAITEYADDVAIPSYAREALYVAQTIGLLSGDESGNINPSKVITRAEAAVMIDRLVEYMRTDLKADYRDRLMDY